METIVKIDVKKIKEDIKKMVDEQKLYKKSRKNATIIVDANGYRHWDPMSPSEAQWKHRMMRKRLRIMYAAYGQARGKSYSQIENRYPEENHPLYGWDGEIKSIIEKYQIMVEIEERGV